MRRALKVTRAEDAGAEPCDEPEAGLPEDVFCTGLYEGRDSSKIASTAPPYTPGATFWSDGAQKQRYLHLPSGTQIDTSIQDSWKFPVGTKAWKEFRINGALIETRILWKRSEADWEAGAYIWDDAGSAATLNQSRKPVIIGDHYEIPTGKDCGKCHHGGADKLLGVEAVLLALPSAIGVTLQALVEAGKLSHPPETAAIELPEDTTGKAAAALAYLHVNCGMPCHSSRGLGEETQLVLRLRADQFWPVSDPKALPSVATSDAYVASLNVAPTTASVAQKFPGALRITPGAHDKSLLWLLAHERGDYQMPPLVSHRVDEPGTQKLADWIDALAP